MKDILREHRDKVDQLKQKTQTAIHDLGRVQKN